MVWTRATLKQDQLEVLNASTFYDTYKEWQYKELSFLVDYHFLFHDDEFYSFKSTHIMSVVKDSTGKTITSISNEELTQYILRSM